MKQEKAPNHMAITVFAASSIMSTSLYAAACFTQSINYIETAIIGMAVSIFLKYATGKLVKNKDMAPCVYSSMLVALIPAQFLFEYNVTYSSAGSSIALSGLLYFSCIAGVTIQFPHLVMHAVRLRLRQMLVHLPAVIPLIIILHFGPTLGGSGYFIDALSNVSFFIKISLSHNYEKSCVMHNTESGNTIGVCEKIVHRYRATRESYYNVDLIVFDSSDKIMLPWDPKREGFEYLGNKTEMPDGSNVYTAPSWRNVSVTSLGKHFYAVSFDPIL